MHARRGRREWSHDARFSYLACGLNSGGSQLSPSSTIRQSESAASQRKPASADLYVVNIGKSVTVYAADAHGHAAPNRTISGSNTELKTSIGVALDADNNIYVANVNNSVTVYAAAANGNVAPIQAIVGPSTGLKSPRGIALGPDGRIYVMNDQKGSVTVYATGANGNVAPIQNVHGSKTGLAGR